MEKLSSAGRKAPETRLPLGAAVYQWVDERLGISDVVKLATKKRFFRRICEDLRKLEALVE